MIVVKHLYIERRMTPLNLFLQTATPAQRARAMRDYGDALRQLAAVNIFAGDLLFKNFGVTRFGRIVFYDYDEIDYLTACNFRKIPPAPAGYDEMSNEVWYPVASERRLSGGVRDLPADRPRHPRRLPGRPCRSARRALVASHPDSTCRRRASRGVVVPGRGALHAPRVSRGDAPAHVGVGDSRRPRLTPSRRRSGRRRFRQPPRDVFGLRRRADVALAGGEDVPRQRLAQVGRDAIAVLVEAADDVLGARIAVASGGFVPARGELPILGRAATEKILGGQLDLRVGVTLLRRFLPPFGRRRSANARRRRRLRRAARGCIAPVPFPLRPLW